MRVMGPGHFLFAAGIAGLGLLSLISGDFAYTWQPVPSGVPHRELLARASGILMMAGGMGMLVKRTAVPMALAMTIYLLSWVFLLQAPRAARAPGDVGAWLGVGESVVLMCGGWILFASLSAQEGRLRIPFVSGPGGIRFVPRARPLSFRVHRGDVKHGSVMAAIPRGPRLPHRNGAFRGGRRHSPGDSSMRGGNA